MIRSERPPYDQRFIDDIRQLLTFVKQRMEEEVAVKEQGIIDYMGGANAGIDQHPADDASAVFQQTLELTMRNTLAGTLLEVNDALQAIEIGAYGQCMTCGLWINPARLRALPFTQRCIRCAQEKAKRFVLPRY